MTRRIELSRGLVAVVDDCDYERVNAVGKWYADLNQATYYARKNFWDAGACRSIKMHSFITGWPLTDHISGDGLDNRRSNLRPATSAQNAQNRRLRSDSKSGFKGVHQRTPYRWSAYIHIDGRRVSLGGHDTPIAAALAYDAAAQAAFGAFARLNFPEENAA